MILFGLYSGARLSDVATLTWQNVDLPAKELRFIARKTGKTIIVPLDGPLAAHVEALPAADSVNAPLHPRAFGIVERQRKTGHLSNQFADLLAQAGLKKEAATPQNVFDREHGRCAGRGHLVPQFAAYRRHLTEGSRNPPGGRHGACWPQQPGNEPALYSRRPHGPGRCGKSIS